MRVMGYDLMITYEQLSIRHDFAIPFLRANFAPVGESSAFNKLYAAKYYLFGILLVSLHNRLMQISNKK